MPGLDDDPNSMQLGGSGNENAVLPQEQQSGLDYVLQWNNRVYEEQENQGRGDLDPMEDDHFDIQNLSSSPRKYFGPHKTVGETSSAIDIDDKRTNAMVSADL